MKLFTDRVKLLLSLTAILVASVGIHAALGASNVIETPVAGFGTSLASPIQTTDTTMTLVSALTGDGVNLASSTYSFTIDGGSSNQEYVKADCTGTVCTNMQRGISAITGTTTIATNIFSHRRGASVQITDHPLITEIANFANALAGYPKPLWYASEPTFTAGLQIPDKTYVDNLAFSGAGVIDATTAARGVSILATQLQSASSTATSGGHPLVIPASTATSTYNAATAALRIIETQNSGKIDNNFISTSSLGLATSAIIQTYSTTTSPATWTKPTGAKVVQIIMIAGGGGGGGSNSTNSNGCGGGGGGTISNTTLDASLLTSTVTVTVGSGGAGGASGGVNSGTGGGNTSFGAYTIASGGGGGGGCGSQAAAGGGGLGSGGGGAAGTAGANGTVGGGGGGSTSGAGGTGSGSSPYFAAGGGGGSGLSGTGGSGGGVTAGTPIFGTLIPGAGGNGGATTVAGSKGGFYGGGGGGAGSATAAGGSGADGFVAVITYF